MAVTQNTYTGDGSTVLFSFTFPYLETTDIKVSLDGSDTTAYTLANATTIQFNTAPTNGAVIRIYRQTEDTILAAQFYPGSAIRSTDLNDNFTQNLYVTQEANRDATQAISTSNTALATAETAVTDSLAATQAYIASNTLTTNQILSLVDDVGGFVPIDSITQFPAGNPDPNDNAGTVVSIKDAINLTHVSGVSQNATTSTGAPVTITGIPDGLASPVTLSVGMLVVTTGTLNTYTFHRLVAPADDVIVISDNIDAITSVAADAGDIGIVSTNIGNVAAIGSDLSNSFVNITDYGSITAAVTSTSGTSRIETVADSIADVNIVSDISSDVTAVAAIDSSVSSVAGNASNINTVATNIADVNSVGPKIADVTTVASNIASVTTCASDIAAIIDAPTQAANASTSASAASASATSASNSAVSSSNSATSASNSATAAASSASAASASATSALGAQTAAEAAAELSKDYRDDTAALLTAAGSEAYDINVNSDFGSIVNAAISFANETFDLLQLTMSKGSSIYNYGTII